MKVIISIIGTSLLSNKLDQYISENRSLPKQFTDCLDKDEMKRFSPKEWKDIRSLVSAIRADTEKELAIFLELPRKFDPLLASAETHSLKLLIDRLVEKENGNLQTVLSQLKLYFVSSNTAAGQACAHALAQTYADTMKVKEVADIEVIEHLTGNPKVFQQGITEMTDRLIGLITAERSKGNEVFLNATGGFKPEATYATLCGLLNQVSVCYAHEYFENEIVWLPPIPLGFDFTPWHLSASKIQLALSGLKPAYDSLPEQIRELMDWDEENGVGKFNQLGHVFWTTYQESCIEHRLSPHKGLLTDRINDHDLQGRILKFIDGWNSIWVGMQLPQMVDHTQAHCQNMLMLAEQLLLPMEGFLTKEEIYILIACIWLHDIGHSEPIEIKPDGTGEALSPQEIRDKHHILTYQLIKNRPTEFGFPSFNKEAEVIATICSHHRKSDLSQLPEKCELTIYDDKGMGELRRGEIRLRLITALLQLIDTCDMGAPRAGSEDYVRARLRVTEREVESLKKRRQIAERAGEKNFAKFLQDNIALREPSRWHFEKHQQIAKVEIKPKRVDHGWKVSIIVHPRNKDVDVIGLITGKPIKATEDINTIKGFLRPYISDVAVEPGAAILAER